MTQKISPPPGLESIPSDWGLTKLKHVADVRASNVDKKTHEDERAVRLCNYVDVYYEDRITSELNLMEATASPDEIQRFRLRRGDVVVTKDSESWDDIAVPAYVTEDLDDVVCGYHLALIRPSARALEGRFLFYCFAAEVINRQLQVAATGVTRFGLPLGALMGAVLPLPPLRTQVAIADLLDRKTAAIDTLIAKRERLLELLAIRRRALITKAVTRGFNPTTTLKDTGVPWVGAIPSDWRIVRLKHLGTGSFMYGANEPAEIRDPDLPRYIRITDLNPDGTLRDDTFRSLPELLARPYMLKDGDILFARSGATVGKAVRYRASWGRACFAGYLIRLRPDKEQVLPEYLEYYTQSEPYTQEVQLSTVQATIQNVGAQRYGEFKVPLPPLSEQQEIVRELDEADHRTRIVSARLTRQIDKLRHWRQVLISSAVTAQSQVGEPPEVMV